MFNHFRTKLLNLSYDAAKPGELISRGFVATQLTQEAARFHSLLFPATLSRENKIRQADSFVTLLLASPYADYLVAKDTRTCLPPQPVYARYTGKPVSSSPDVTLAISGSYTPDLSKDSLFREITIVQSSSNSNSIVVIDKATSNVLLSTTLTFSAGKSNLVTVPSLAGLSFYFVGAELSTLSQFTSTFTVSAENPQLDVQSIIQNARKTRILHSLINSKPLPDLTQVDNAALNETNLLYGFNASLVSFVERLA